MSIGPCPHWGKSQLPKSNRLRWCRIPRDSAILRDCSMASDKQIAANRRNAMRSTGPRTRSGKARSRANSLRHGLLSKVLVDPPLANETDQLARRIAQEHGKPDDCFESRTIAEAELIILSARAVRAQLLDTTSSELAPDTKADDGRHSEQGSLGGGASVEERDLALA